MIDPKKLEAAVHEILADPSRVEAAADAAIKDNDLATAWSLAGDMVSLGFEHRAPILQKLKKHFGVSFSVPEFRKEIKAREQAARSFEYQNNPDYEWRRGMLQSQNGALKPCLANAAQVLRQHPECCGILGFDQFSLQVWTQREPPWGGGADRPWTNQDDRKCTEWMQKITAAVFGPEIVGSAIETIAEENAFHPVREYLDALEWDSEPRLDGWLRHYLGCRWEKPDYLREIGVNWILSAIARVHIPGCQADSMLVLEGKQGVGKSSALRILADPWFTDELASLDDKDSSMQVAGVWVIELSELATLTRGELEGNKAFITRRKDRFRPPYGKRVMEAPRQCVFAGSVNHTEYLKDETGARRFWPCRVGKIKRDELEDDRDQLWAEAMYRWTDPDTPARWWMEDERILAMTSNEQKRRYIGDAWEPMIASALESQYGDEISIDEVYGIVKRSSLDISQQDRNRIHKILRSEGWEVRQVRRDGVRPYVAFQTKEEPES